MKRLVAILILTTAAPIVLSATPQIAQRSVRKGGRYDQQIRTELARILRKEARYKNVKADVEDSVVTLAGSVELDSIRRALADRVRKIAHVETVDNELLLDPPAVPDQALYGRVVRNLADAGFAELKCTVHEGAVTLEGTVTDQKQRQRVIDLVRRTEGVKEVEARLSFASR